YSPAHWHFLNRPAKPAWSDLYVDCRQNDPVRSNQHLALPVWWLKLSLRKNYHIAMKMHRLKLQYAPDCSSQYSRFAPAHPAWSPEFHRHINARRVPQNWNRSEEHTSELQSRENLVCRLLLEK